MRRTVDVNSVMYCLVHYLATFINQVASISIDRQSNLDHTANYESSISEFEVFVCSNKFRTFDKLTTKVDVLLTLLRNAITTKQL